MLRPGYEAFELPSLPFVSEPKEGEEGKSCWAPERPENLTLQAELGRRLGAAYFLFIARNGSQPLPLPWILEHMTGEDDHVARTFFSYLLKVLFDFGHMLSARDIEEHVEAVIANDRLHYEEGELEAAGLAGREDD